VGGFFECGLEGGDEVVGEVADEADGVAEHEVVPGAQVPLAGAGHEGGEEAVVGVGAAGGEGVEEGGLAGVGVSDDADGEVLLLAGLDFAALAGLDFTELALEVVLAGLDESAVDFELLLARAAGADAGDAAGADDSLEVGPHGAEAWVGVFELGEFDLELGLVGAGAGGEDVEDEFGAIDDFSLGGLLDLGELFGREVVVEDDGGGVEGLAEAAEFFDLAGAHVGAGDGLGEVLGQLADDDRAGLLGERAEFAERVGGVVVGVGEADGGDDGAFALDLEFAAFLGGWHKGKGLSGLGSAGDAG
jgi:hypothetical protein